MLWFLSSVSGGQEKNKGEKQLKLSSSGNGRVAKKGKVGFHTFNYDYQASQRICAKASKLKVLHKTTQLVGQRTNEFFTDKRVKGKG